MTTPNPEAPCPRVIEEPVRFTGVCVDHGALVAGVDNLAGNVELLRNEVFDQGKQTRAAVNYASSSVSTLTSAVNMLRSDFDRREATRTEDTARARWVDQHRRESERSAWARSKAVKAVLWAGGVLGTVGAWEGLSRVLPVVWRAIVGG